MKMPKATVNMLDTVISEELTKYSKEVADVLKMNTIKVAEECKDEIKSRSPADKGKYKRWLFGTAAIVAAIALAVQYLMWLL